MANGQAYISSQKIPPDHLSLLYNAADCTINIADAEGFGLATLESLSCGTPVVVNMTGGLQEQITDGKEFFGVPIFPSSKAIIGSQGVPYICEDRISSVQFVSALEKIYNLPSSHRREMGLNGRKHVINNYGFPEYRKKWVEIMTNLHENQGSWDTRRNYNSVRFGEIK